MQAITTFAHVKWFVDDTLPNVEPLKAIEWVAILLSTIIIIVALAWLARTRLSNRFSAAIDRRIDRFGWLAPHIIRFTTALLLIVNAFEGLIFAPNVERNDSTLGWLISAILLVSAAGLLTKRLSRLSGIGMIAAYGLGLLSVQPVVDVLDHIEYLGIGLYLVLHDFRPYVKTQIVKKNPGWLSPESLLRVFVGLGVAILALSEKLVGIANSYNFLGYHQWNFLQLANVNDREFIIIAGIIELAVGLTLILNIAPRLTTAIVAALMSVTALLLGLSEVFGHLFIFSLVAIVWLSPQPGLVPWRRKAPPRVRTSSR